MRFIPLNKNILSLDIASNSNTKISNAELGGMLLSFSSVGFTLDKESIQLLKNYSAEELKDYQVVNYHDIEDYNANILFAEAKNPTIGSVKVTDGLV